MVLNSKFAMRYLKSANSTDGFPMMRPLAYMRTDGQTPTIDFLEFLKVVVIILVFGACFVFHIPFSRRISLRCQVIQALGQVKYPSPKLLIIYNFHWSRRVSPIIPIRQFYIPYLRRSLKFPFDVVFYSPKSFPDLGIQSNGLTDNGHFSIHTFAVAYHNRSHDYMGYLQLNDDGVLNPFQFNQHDMRKLAFEQNTLHLGPNRQWCWYSRYLAPGRNGWQTLQDWFEDVCDNPDYSSLSMCRTYKNGTHYIGYSDFFYVPGKYAETFARLAEKCTERHVFLEMCAPTIGSNFPWVNLGRDLPHNPWPEDISDQVGHYHPIKFSDPHNVERLKRFINLTEKREGRKDDRYRAGGATGAEFRILKVKTIHADRPAFHSREFVSLTKCRAKTWAVVTSINDPTKAINQLSKMPAICQVVVGDVKSPPYPPSSGNTVFLSYDEQLKLGYSIVRLLPSNSFARASIGYLFAIQHGAAFIYDYDDDNILINASYGINQLNNPPLVTMTLTAKANVVNPYAFYRKDGITHIWPRGFPIELIKDSDPQLLQRKSDKISVFQFLQNLNPDLDAMYRLTHDIPETFDSAKGDCIAIELTHYAPFNAQATLFHENAFFGMVLPLSVNGRVSDIWRSYILERVLRIEGEQIAFCPALVEHHRNQHGLTRDFNAELPLYQQTAALLAFMDKSVEPTKGDKLESLREAYVTLIEHNILGEEDLAFVDAWIEDYRNAKNSIRTQ
jgi:hypothetical protein